LKFVGTVASEVQIFAQQREAAKLASKFQHEIRSRNNIKIYKALRFQINSIHLSCGLNIFEFLNVSDFHLQISDFSRQRLNHDQHGFARHALTTGL